MAEITYREALNQALSEEISRDPNVVLMGEEVAQFKGSYKVSEGFWRNLVLKKLLIPLSAKLHFPACRCGYDGNEAGGRIYVLELLLCCF